MPRSGGNYVLPSPPYPFQPDTLANANDLDTVLSDIATALTNSVPTNGAAAWSGNQNANNYNLGGVNTLTAATVNAGYLTTSSNASIGNTGVVYSGIAGTTGHGIAFNWDGSYLHEFVDGNDEGPIATTTWVSAQGLATEAWCNGIFMPLSGGTASNITVSGPLSVGGNSSFSAGLTVGGNLQVNGGIGVNSNALFSGGFTVAGQGIGYSSVGSGTYPIAFAWDGATVQVYVAGIHQGSITGTRAATAMEQRLAALEARVRELEAQLERVAAH